MKAKLSILAALCLLVCVPAGGQFYLSGDNPASTRWSTITTKNYSLIYPSGLDSLAAVFGTQLEQWRIATGRSAGFLPNDQYKRKMPVVLQSFTSDANGLVVWAPHRMELRTVPDAYGPESLVWEQELATHEGRHVTQMQFAHKGKFKFWSLLLGDISTGAFSGIYTGPAFFEGDAVATETALSASGRGRSADFLEYQMVAYDNGDWRNWYQWRYGSLDKFAPDYYRIGYIRNAGVRYLYDEPLFTKKYYDALFRKPLVMPFFVLKRTMKDISGKKYKETFLDIEKSFYQVWSENAAARGPFQTDERLTAAPKHYTEYIGSTSDGNNIWSIEKGLYSAGNLVKIAPDGSVERFSPFSATTGSLQWSEAAGKFFWSESVNDIRWGMKSTSRIRFMDPKDGRKHDLTTEGRLYNPAPSPDGKLIAATEYPYEGGTRAVVLNAEDGSLVNRYIAPDGLQIVECVWVDGRLVASGICENGFALYDVLDGFSTLLEPQQVKIKQLRSDGSTLYFISDRTGVNELYSLRDGSVKQLSRSRYGISDYIIPEGNELVCSILGTDGRMVHKVQISDGEEVDFSDIYRDPISDRLSAQERELVVPDSSILAERGVDVEALRRQLEEKPAVELSEPKPYRKLAHPFRIHSWAPLYVNYDDIESLSFDNIYYLATLGATVFFQNMLGTVSGSFGYKAEPDHGEWLHSLHGKVKYTGLYPVIEASIDIGGGNARSYIRNSYDAKGILSMSTVSSALTSLPSVSGKVKAYVPLNFSSGGWYRGLVPQVQYAFSNDLYNTSLLHWKYTDMVGQSYFYDANGCEGGKAVPLSRLCLSVRGYSVLGTAKSAVYPRLGLGFEAGYNFRPGLSDIYTPNAFAYLYGYVPGLVEGHGVRLSATVQKEMNGIYKESYASVMPRGYASDYSTLTFLASQFPLQSCLTADYAFNALPVDCSLLGAAAYIRNFQFGLHFDGGVYGGAGSGAETLFSGGGSVALKLGNLLWIPYETKIGVTYSCNFGPLYDYMNENGAELQRHYTGMIFSIDF